MRRSDSIILAAAAGLLAASGSVSGLPGLGSTPAAAQFWWSAPSPYYRPRFDPRQRAMYRLPRTAMPKPSAEELAASKSTASGPLIVTVSIASQRMTVYDASGPIIRGPVSTGKAGHRTPTGVFSIIQKNRHHRSNIYSGAPMPYMQRITWSGVALHAGVLPGYPASAGCIRMTYPIAAKLFAMSKLGMRVVIAQHEPVASVFSHPELPEPLMVAALVEQKDVKAEGEAAAAPIRVAASEGGADAAQVATRFLNPMQHAAVERTRSRARLVETTRANKELLQASLRASAEAKAASAAVRAAQAGVATLNSRLAAASAEARVPLEAQLAEAERGLAELTAAATEKSTAAYAAARASREAEEAQTAAETAVRMSERGTEPIAVFISRRESKVFVRQGMTPLFEAPVTFKEPNRSIGTHVFQVMSGDTDTGRLTWQQITMPESAGHADWPEYRPPVRRGERGAPPAPIGPPSDARNALERVVMSPEVKRRISERLWVNGSIVISDQGISNETGKGTDFIVLSQ